MSAMKFKSGQRLFLIGCLLFNGTVFCIDSPLIQSEVAATYSPDVDAQALETALRGRVETTQVNAINNSLYFTGDMFARIVTGHFPGNCSPDTETGYTCPSDRLLQHGDLKPTGMLALSTYQNPTERSEADLFLQNLVDPFPATSILTQINPSQLATTANKQAVAQALANQAVLSVARYPLVEMIERRAPNAGVSGVNTAGAAVQNISWMAFVEQQVGQRFMNSAWETNLAKATDRQAMVEMAKLLAFQSWMQYQQYRQMERVESLLAAQLVQNVRLLQLQTNQTQQMSSTNQSAQSQYSPGAEASSPTAAPGAATGSAMTSGTTGSSSIPAIGP